MKFLSRKPFGLLLVTAMIASIVITTSSIAISTASAVSIAKAAITESTSTDVSVSPSEVESYTATTTNADCRDYYNLNGVAIDIKPRLIRTVAGAEMAFNGTVSNDNKYPIINGKLYAKIYRDIDFKNSSNDTDSDLVDTFVVLDKINLKAGEKLPVNFSWKIPIYSISGNYKLATYFLSSDKFNLAGLNFTDGTYGGLTGFSVKGQQTKIVSFDRGGTMVNGKIYPATYTSLQSATDPVVITIPVTNTTNITQAVLAVFNVYKWDTQSTENKIDTITKTVVIPAGKTINVPISVKDNQFSVYYVESVLKYKDSKSILEVRFARDGVNMPRINFSSIVSYPLVAGKKNKIFSCFYNASSNNNPIDGKLKLDILKDDDTVVFSYEYDGKITANMEAITQDFVPKGSYNNFKIHASLFEGSKLVDEVYIPYSCNLIDQTKCNNSAFDNMSSSGGVKLLFEILGIIILLIIIILAIFKSKSIKAMMSGFMKNHLRMLSIMLSIMAIIIIASPLYSYAAVLNTPIPVCPGGANNSSGSGGSGGDLIINAQSPNSADMCDNRPAATVNTCVVTNRTGSSIGGFNLNKISSASLQNGNYPVTITNLTSTSANFAFIRLGEGLRNIVISYTDSVGKGQRCQLPFTFACTQPVIGSIDPDHGPTAGGNTITLQGRHFYNVASVKIGNVNVAASSFTFLTDNMIQFAAPAEAAGWKGVGIKSICWSDVGQSVSMIDNAYNYTEIPQPPKPPVPPPVPPYWVVTDGYNYTKPTVNNPGLYYWTFNPNIIDGGVWKYAMPETGANLNYNSIVTDNNGVVIGSGSNIKIGTYLHFGFDNFSNNSNVNWYNAGGVGSSYKGKWVSDAGYPTGSVCSSSNLYASNVTQTDPNTGVMTSNVNVYVPFSVKPPETRLSFGANDTINFGGLSASLVLSWGAPPVPNDDIGNWYCSTSDPNTCYPMAAGRKNVYMYYSPTYGYYYYGWQVGNGTCNTNSVPLHQMISMNVNTNQADYYTGQNSTCTIGTSGCSKLYLDSSGSVVGCSKNNPYYNIDDNKCYTTFQNFLNSYHKDLTVVDGNGVIQSGVPSSYYNLYQSNFREFVYKLNLNVVSTSTISSITKPTDPQIFGSTTVYRGQSAVYGTFSNMNTIFTKEKSNSIFAKLTSLFKKAFAQTDLKTVRYYFDWDGNVANGAEYISNDTNYSVMATTSITWPDAVGNYTLKVMAEDTQTLSTSSWTALNVTVIDPPVVPLASPIVKIENDCNQDGTRADMVRFYWDTVPGAGYYWYQVKIGDGTWFTYDTGASNELAVPTAESGHTVESYVFYARGYSQTDVDNLVDSAGSNTVTTSVSGLLPACVKTTTQPIMSANIDGLNFYPKPLWAGTDGTCKFYGSASSTIKATTADGVQTIYSGATTTCNIDYGSLSYNLTSVPGFIESKKIGKHTLFCSLTYNDGKNPDGSTKRTTLPSQMYVESKCSKLPSVIEK